MLSWNADEHTINKTVSDERYSIFSLLFGNMENLNDLGEKNPALYKIREGLVLFSGTKYFNILSCLFFWTGSLAGEGVFVERQWSAFIECLLYKGSWMRTLHS